MCGHICSIHLPTGLHPTPDGALELDGGELGEFISPKSTPPRPFNAIAQGDHETCPASKEEYVDRR